MEDTQAQLMHIQNLRILEEEKLRLLKTAQEVEDQKTILISRQRKPSENGDSPQSRHLSGSKTGSANIVPSVVEKMNDIESLNIHEEEVGNYNTNSELYYKRAGDNNSTKHQTEEKTSHLTP